MKSLGWAAIGAALIALLGLSAPSDSAAQVYQCTSPTGQKTMQQTPCAGGGVKVVDAPKAAISPADQAKQKSRIDFCKSTAEAYASWVVNASNDLGKFEGGVSSLQRRLEREQSYDPGVVNRLTARSTALLGAKMTKAEARADLYSLCLAIHQ